MQQQVETLPPLTALTEDEVLFRDSVFEFADREIRPLVREMDEQAKIPRELIDKLFDLGVMAVEIPEAYGGAGATFFHSVLAVEAISRVDPSVGVLVDVQNTLVVNALNRWGNDEMKRRYLSRLASGTVGAYALSEAGSGSDAFALAARAAEAGDEFVLTGRKLWITNGNEADIFIVFATINPEAGYRGITAFMVERGMPGFIVGKKEDKLGIRASSTCELLLEDGIRVRYVPSARLEAEMPDTVAAATGQNQRWERGRAELTKRYPSRLARHALVGGRAPRTAYGDALVDLLVPPLSDLLSDLQPELPPELPPGRREREHLPLAAGHICEGDEPIEAILERRRPGLNGAAVAPRATEAVVPEGTMQGNVTIKEHRMWHVFDEVVVDVADLLGGFEEGGVIDRAGAERDVRGVRRVAFEGAGGGAVLHVLEVHQAEAVRVALQEGDGVLAGVDGPEDVHLVDDVRRVGGADERVEEGAVAAGWLEFEAVDVVAEAHAVLLEAFAPGVEVGGGFEGGGETSPGPGCFFASIMTKPSRAVSVPRLSQLWLVACCTITSPASIWTMAPSSSSMSIPPARHTT